MATSLLPVEIRDRLCESLDLDLVGPANDSPLATEAVPQEPSRWYLAAWTGRRRWFGALNLRGSIHGPKA